MTMVLHALESSMRPRLAKWQGCAVSLCAALPRIFKATAELSRWRSAGACCAAHLQEYLGAGPGWAACCSIAIAVGAAIRTVTIAAIIVAVVAGAYERAQRAMRSRTSPSAK